MYKTSIIKKKQGVPDALSTRHVHAVVAATVRVVKKCASIFASRMQTSNNCGVTGERGLYFADSQWSNSNCIKQA